MDFLKILVAAALALLVPSQGCTKRVGDACETTRECEPGLLCVRAACRAPGEPGHGCEAQGECAIGLACLEGACFQLRKAGEACKVKEQCLPELSCLEEKCSELRKVGERCSDGTWCSSGLVCFMNKCCEKEDAAQKVELAKQAVSSHVEVENLCQSSETARGNAMAHLFRSDSMLRKVNPSDSDVAAANKELSNSEAASLRAEEFARKAQGVAADLCRDNAMFKEVAETEVARVLRNPGEPGGPISCAEINFCQPELRESLPTALASVAATELKL
jgi:hypothetical protein